MSSEEASERKFDWSTDRGTPKEDQTSEWGVLPPGMSSQDLESAISHSGYPLQETVANILQSPRGMQRGGIFTQEEWAYLDADSGQIRSIDLYAEFRLGDRQGYPYLNLLVECKQSEMPYVFFLRGASPSRAYDFPEVLGVASTDIKLHSKESSKLKGRAFSVSIQDLLEVWDFPFFEFPCPFAISVSKAARRPSGRFELTGEDAYKALTLPLLKAGDHLKTLTDVKEPSGWLGCRLLICIAVLRAPMFGVYRTNERDMLAPLPWVRVCRLEPQPKRPQSIVRYYDCVHESYLSTYIDKMLADVRGVARRIQDVAGIITAGEGMVNDENKRPTYLGLSTIKGKSEMFEQKVDMTVARVTGNFKFRLDDIS